MIHQAHFWVISKGRETKISKTWLYSHVHLSIIGNNQDTHTRAEHPCGNTFATQGTVMRESSLTEESKPHVATLTCGI